MKKSESNERGGETDGGNSGSLGFKTTSGKFEELNVDTKKALNADAEKKRGKFAPGKTYSDDYTKLNERQLLLELLAAMCRDLEMRKLERKAKREAREAEREERKTREAEMKVREAEMKAREAEMKAREAERKTREAERKIREAEMKALREAMEADREERKAGRDELVELCKMLLNAQKKGGDKDDEHKNG